MSHKPDERPVICGLTVQLRECSGMRLRAGVANLTATSGREYDVCQCLSSGDLIINTGDRYFEISLRQLLDQAIPSIEVHLVSEQSQEVAEAEAEAGDGTH